MSSQWRWAGFAFMDDEGNVVAWEVERPDGQFAFQQVITRSGRHASHLKAEITGSIKQWNGQIPNPPSTLDYYLPPPVESGG